MKRIFLALLIAALTTSTVLAKEPPKVDVFVTSWCPYCVKLESFLKDNGIAYNRYDVESDSKGAQIFTEIGGEGVPVSRVGNKVIRGYDPEGILSALQGSR